MRELLPYYERELGYLRRYGREFADRYPKIAGRLQLAAEGSQDPHVERLIEAFAFLGARISKRIEDDYPEFTDALLEVLYPHYLRPFPSCSIAQFDMTGAARLSAPLRIPRGTPLQSRPVRGVQCRFRTVYDVVLGNVGVAAAAYRPVAEPPLATTLAPGSGGQVSMRFDFGGDPQALAQMDGTLRLFVDGEPSLRAALRDALSLDVHAAYVEWDEDGRWRALPSSPLRPVGFSEDEALIDYPARSHPAYRLLTEFFAYPEKFGFFDLDVAVAAAGARRGFTLHLVLRSAAGERSSRALEPLSADNIRLGCTPVANLFEQVGEPIRVTHRQVAYPVVADARRAWAYEIHAIDSVHQIRQGPQGESIRQFRPFYSLHHGEEPERAGQYWMARRDEEVATRSPGHEVEISFVDLEFEPVQPQADVVSVRLTCSNRDLPVHLSYGAPQGDLAMEGGTPAKAIRFLRKPSPPWRFPHGRGAQWRLVSHLSLNQLSLAKGGVAALKEMLRLYELGDSSVTTHMIDGLVDLHAEAATAWLPGARFGAVVRGVEIRLVIDEAHFVGTGVACFAHVMDRFFGLYVTANSFTRLVLVSAGNGREIVRCPERSGDSILV
ncbi:type VI secretion system baseplate subunit TssF [Xanthomonas massiliensis]|uniref:type VI secretion system baseplate subunit TssF n=1 Tax=Xanthomonas massiliensis TaxID=1720302 RepID=UPI00082618FA|nr:type VI secretion system baseplate subunit TssF [Xanthomonas massiliensis]